MTEDIDTLRGLVVPVAPVLTGCARCGLSFHGGLDAGREWFRAHLAADHRDVRVNPRPKPPGPGLNHVARRSSKNPSLGSRRGEW